MENLEKLDKIMAIAQARAIEVLKLPYDKREAYFKSYTALSLNEARREDMHKAELLAAMINAATLALVQKIENGGGGGRA